MVWPAVAKLVCYWFGVGREEGVVDVDLESQQVAKRGRLAETG